MFRPDKLAFFLGATVFVFLYGFGAAVFELPPGGQVYRALRQAAGVLSAPHFVADRVYDWEGARVHDPAAVQDGLTLVASVWGVEGGTGGSRTDLRLLDLQGRVLHAWAVPDPVRLFSTERRIAGGPKAEKGVHGAYLLPDGHLLANWTDVGTVRLDACSRVVWKVERGNHHSIAPAADGSFWIPVTDVVDEAKSDRYPAGYPGLEGPIAHDGFIQVSDNGAIVREYRVLDILYQNDLHRYLTKAKVIGLDDPMHLNDVEPLDGRMADEYPLFEEGDLLLSLRNLELVLVVDPRTLEVRWHASEPFIQQHDPDFIGDGWIGVFDNNRDNTERGTVLGGSRIVAVQPHTGSVRVLYPTSRADPLYTEVMGKFQKLDNGNLLLTEARPGRIVEVAPDGRTVWEWARAALDEEQTVEVSEGTRYPLTLEQAAAWPCTLTGSRPQTEGIDHD